MAHEINESEIKQIKQNLMSDYSAMEVDEMISAATLTRSSKGVDVEYDNGQVDNFIFVKRLVHSTEVNN